MNLCSASELVNNYRAWLKEKPQLKNLDTAVEITTPFLDRHNDYIQIYLLNSEGGLLLSDDGYTISDLELSGCNLNTRKRMEILHTTLNGFGVSLVDGALQVKANETNFPSQKHNLLQAILAVNDLFYVARANVQNFFSEDVSLWLDENNVRYVPDATFAGKSNFNHKFDFIIPRSKVAPERIIRAINNPSKEGAMNMAFAWIDTIEQRKGNSQAYALLNNTDKTIDKSISDALSNYGIISVPWTERTRYIEQFLA